MKLLTIAALSLAATLTAAPVNALPTAQSTAQAEIAHGGGCRKSSPPGQCCHMKRATGVVHCH